MVRALGPQLLHVRRRQAVDRTLQDLLTAVLTAPRLPRSVFAPELLERVPVDRLQLMVDQLRERHGAVRSVQPHEGLWRVHCADGGELLWAGLDGDGLLTSLVLGPAALTARRTAAEPPGPRRAAERRVAGPSTRPVAGPAAAARPAAPAPPAARPAPVSTAAQARQEAARRYALAAAGTAGWAVLQLALALAAVSATQWLLLLLAAAAAAWCLLHVGPWHALPPYARLLPGAAVAGTAAAGLRVPAADLAWDLRAPLALLPPLAVLAAAAWTAARCRPRTDPADPPLVLASPLRGGTLCLLQAGGPALNRHAADAYGRAARLAVDLTVLGSGLRWRRRRALGLMPAENDAYAAYGHPVRSPCDGVVAVAVDGLPDNEPGAVDPAHPLGNHVAVDTGRALVVLAHLQPGSVRVRAGARVSAGTMLGAVGNSGDTGGEPLLHLRAETRTSTASPGSGTALPLLLGELRGAPLRGRRLTVEG
ncbi:M23 family metallopeptidase [Streptomyces sp. NPDC001380]|uniref:M23 family metallopeptidase n=1 Tax=Streptomyces sp. NPDC001380 TaxID=3364566 RepID=UPI00367DF123